MTRYCHMAFCFAATRSNLVLGQSIAQKVMKSENIFRITRGDISAITDDARFLPSRKIHHIDCAYCCDCGRCSIYTRVGVKRGANLSPFLLFAKEGLGRSDLNDRVVGRHEAED